VSPAGRVTVVVMTRDRWPDLRSSLPRHEAPVILVDNGSHDGTPDLVRSHFPGVEVVELGTNRGSVARNVGVERARTPYVAFADDDSWWAPGALERAADVLDEHPRLAVLAARMLVGVQERPDPICAMMRDSPLGRPDDLPGPSVLGFLACGAVVRREAYLAGGGFDDVVFFMGEEERLALDLAALGWGLAYVDEVVAGPGPAPAGAAGSPAAAAARGGGPSAPRRALPIRTGPDRAGACRGQPARGSPRCTTLIVVISSRSSGP
jgi:GT2 family glycosyltransferase